MSRRAKWPSGDTESKALLETIVIDVATEAVRLYTEGQEPPLWTCGLFVVVSGGKYRCIHDARPINEHLPDGSVSYKEFSSSLNPEMRYALKTDIWSAFKQIPVSEADTPKLGFSVGEVLGAYRTLPLGLRQSPKRFCAAIRPVILAARALEVYCVWYVDDVLILGRTPREAVDGIMIFHQLLKRVGLLLAPNKFVPILATRISFLGRLIDYFSKVVKPERRKLEKLQSLARSFLIQGASVKELESFLGLLNFIKSPKRPLPTAAIQSLLAVAYANFPTGRREVGPMVADELHVICRS